MNTNSRIILAVCAGAALLAGGVAIGNLDDDAVAQTPPETISVASTSTVIASTSTTALSTSTTSTATAWVSPTDAWVDEYGDVVAKFMEMFMSIDYRDHVDAVGRCDAIGRLLGGDEGKVLVESVTQAPAVFRAELHKALLDATKSVSSCLELEFQSAASFQLSAISPVIEFQLLSGVWVEVGSIQAPSERAG